MPIRLPSMGREGSSQAKFRIHLDAAVRSAATGARVDVVAMEAMVGLVRSKELSPGDSLSCFKTYFREGTPDEQHRALIVLSQFVGTDPHLANLLHIELASKRWRDRFVHLAGSPHPEVKPLLITTLQGWAASYRAHDIGMHYQSTLRDLSSGGGPFRGGGAGGSGYNTQYTGYSAQQTGYSTQATGAGYPPPPGYPAPGGGPPVGYPAYPPYGGPPAPYPPAHHQPPQQRIANPSDVSSKLDQLVSEVELLRGAIRALESALADYKAQRCPFAALSAALERGQRTADRCSALQVQIENMVGHSDGGDESLMARLFSTNDSAVAALEQWRRLANQELAPDDAAGGAAATSAAAAARPTQPPPPPPAPTPLDLLLGDEIISPTPPPPQPAAAASSNGLLPNGGSAAAAGFSASTAFDVFGAAAPSASSHHAGAAAAGPPVVPALDMEGLRSQVLALAAELEKQRKVHATALEAQEAFHRGELAQVKTQAHARISELEAALGRQQSSAAAAGPGPSNPYASNPYGGGASPAPTFPPPMPMPMMPPMPLPMAYPTYQTPATAAAAAPPPPPSGAASNNPFAAFTSPGGGGGGGYGAAGLPPAASGPAMMSAPPPPPAPVAASMSSLPLTMPSPPVAAAPPPPGDILNAFDELAAATSLKPSGGGGAPVPMAAMGAGQQQQQQQAGGPPAGAGAGAGVGGSWVNFGH